MEGSYVGSLGVGFVEIGYMGREAAGRTNERLDRGVCYVLYGNQHQARLLEQRKGKSIGWMKEKVLDTMMLWFCIGRNAGVWLF